MSKTKTVRLTLILATPKTVEELKQIIIRLSKTPGVNKIEQAFPDAQDIVLQPSAWSTSNRQKSTLF